MGPTIIQTERTNLRAWTLGDAPALIELFAHQDVSRFINDGQPLSSDEAFTIITKFIRLQNERGWCRWALELADEPDVLAGFCGVGCTFAPEIELGWTLRRDLWGQGLATEAAAGALDYCFYTVGFKEIISAIDEENTASVAVARRLGMHKSGGDDLEYMGQKLARFVIYNPSANPPSTPGLVANCDGEAAGPSSQTG